MPTVTLEHWPLDTLIEYDKNPRKNDHAVDQMCAAITEMGFKVPIIALSNGQVVDGHLRLKAARKLQLEQVPVILADDLTETQIKAFRIMINQSAHWADWDMDLLKEEMQALDDVNYDVNLMTVKRIQPMRFPILRRTLFLNSAIFGSWVSIVCCVGTQQQKNPLTHSCKPN
jgi:hypothetical protein